MITILFWVGATLMIFGGFLSGVSRKQSLREVQGSFVALIGAVTVTVGTFLEGDGGWSPWLFLTMTALMMLLTYMSWAQWQASLSQDADSTHNRAA